MVMPYIGYQMAKAPLIKPDSQELISESAPVPPPPARKNNRLSVKPPRMPAGCSRAWVAIKGLATQWL
jgi:hypothetical protein